MSTNSLLSAPPTCPPRERRVPDTAVRSWGPDARELAAIAGIDCLPWQQLVIDDMLGERVDGKWACREAGVVVPRQNGKSVIGVVRVLAGLYTLGEELLVYTAHQVSTAEEVFLRLVDRIDSTPDLRRRLRKVSHARGDKGIELANPRQRMLVKARSKESVRGFSADLIVLDEAQLGLNEDDMAALGPTQRARPNPQTVVMGTPALESGTYWGRLRRRALVGDGRMCWHEWSPPDGYERADPAVWRSTNPAHGILIDDEAIEHDLKTLGSRFDAEALGAWPLEREDRGWELIAEADWLACQDPDSEISGPFAFAIEADHDLSHLSIGGAGRRADGLRHLELVERFPADVGRLVGWLRKRLGDDEKRPALVVIDPNGPASYLIPDVERHCEVEVVKPPSREVAAACGSVFVGIAGDPDARDVRVRTVERLEAALVGAVRSAQWRNRGDAKVFDRRHDSAAPVSPLLAVTLADWAMSTMPAMQPFFGGWR